MEYIASESRYAAMQYRRCGKSGLLLPAISLGLWQNFGERNDFDNCRAMLLKAFDNGITYFDLANNYGPPPGSAERTFGRVIGAELRGHRDELVIASKAGYTMWEGPYGDWGSRKYLIASCDQSLRRTGLDYFDIFYSHRYDPGTPIEETMAALDQIVRSGKALYAAISNYPPKPAAKAIKILKKLGTPCVAHQIKYSMLVQETGDSLFALHAEKGVGCVSFSPLAQGMLTDRYLNGIPEGSRAAHRIGPRTLSPDFVTEHIGRIKALNDIAAQRGQSLAQMAIAWQLCDERITSVLVGASSPAQLENNLGALGNTRFTDGELVRIDEILNNRPCPL